MSNEFWYGVATGVGVLGWLIIITVFLAAVIPHRGKNGGGGK